MYAEARARPIIVTHKRPTVHVGACRIDNFGHRPDAEKRKASGVQKKAERIYNHRLTLPLRILLMH